MILFSGCETTGTSSTSTASGGKSTTPPGYIALEHTLGASPESPVYVLTVFDDGTVIFEGHANVRRRGTFTKHLPRETALALFRQLEVIEFWQRLSRYDEDRVSRGRDEIIARVAPLDAPRDVITARYRGRFKRIEGLFFAPSDLIDFKHTVETTTGLAEWVNPVPVAQPAP